VSRDVSRVAAAAALAGALVVNALAVALPLGGRTTGELSARYPNLFVPAGITFSIWTVIYILLAAWAMAQFRAANREPARRIAPAFALSSVLNAAWLYAWHHGRVGLSVLVMAALLAVLLRVNVLLAGERRVLPRAAFGIYLGWISVATIANVTALLVAAGWAGAGIPAAAWATLLVLAGTAAGALATVRLASPFVGLAVIWALAGIALGRWADHRGIAVTALAMAAVLAITAVRTARPDPGPEPAP
jgi:tryptophan-rich sensory protein